MLEFYQNLGNYIHPMAALLVSIGIIFTTLWKIKYLWCGVKWISKKFGEFITPNVVKEIRSTQIEWLGNYKIDGEKDKIEKEKINAALIEIQETNKKQGEKLSEISKAMWNGGREGMVQQVARLSTVRKIDFEHANSPQFECDNKGVNISINEAYRKLVQIWNVNDIRGSRWQEAVYGDLLDDYLGTFMRSSEHGEDFIADVDFREPLSGKHRGRWKIQGSAIHMGDDVLYYGKFIRAIDETAKRLVEEYDWDVSHE